MDTYNVETIDIDLQQYLKLLYRRKYYIIAIVLFCLISSYIISAFFIRKEYQSEMWIQLHANFLYGQEEIPLEYIQIYLNYPEVISSIMVNELYDINSYRNRLNVQKTNNIIRLSLRYPDDNLADEILGKWVSAMQLKLVLDVGSTRVSVLQDDKVALQVKLDLMETKYSGMKDILELEGQYAEIEVVSYDSQGVAPVVLKELNPNYINLKEQANNLQIEIAESTNRKLLITELEKDYKGVLEEINQIFISGISYDITEILTKLKLIQARYSAYYQDKEETSNCALIPFQIISDPNTRIESVYPNILLNTVLAGFMGLCLGIFLIIVVDIVNNGKKEIRELDL